jgi:16S rRNA (guanine966-N2)-methyltransferase
MSDKIRGALFNTLGDLDDMTVLDAYSGTGALSFEAISRGASKVIAIDSDKQAQRAISDNVYALGLEKQVDLIRSTAQSWVNREKVLYDVVLLDPPYTDLRRDHLAKLAQKCRPGGIVVLSLPPAALEQVKLNDGYELLTQKTYGDAALVFYRRNE